MDVRKNHAVWTGTMVFLIVLFAVGEQSAAVEPVSGKWVGGAGIGFIANTTNDEAFALNMHSDRFFTEQVSIGPLMQLGVAGDLFQTGLSGQGKFWLDLPGTNERMKIALEGGLGFVHADHLLDDTSFLFPIGASWYYRATERLSVGATFLLNITDLDTGFGNDTNIMPALSFGARF